MARAFQEINRLRRELEIKDLELQRLKKLNQVGERDGGAATSRERQTANPKRREESEMSDLTHLKEHLFWTTYKSPGREELSTRKISPSRRYAGASEDSSPGFKLIEDKENLRSWRNATEKSENQMEGGEETRRGDSSWLCEYEISPQKGRNN